MFDPCLFLSLAEKLLRNPILKTCREEAVWRTIVSRAYYASHLNVRERLRRRFPSELTRHALARKGKSEHIEVERLLLIINLEGLRDMHQELRVLRIKADYNLREVITRDDALKSVKLSKYILSKIKMYMR